MHRIGLVQPTSAKEISAKEVMEKALNNDVIASKLVADVAPISAVDATVNPVSRSSVMV
jgi:hypothetical protein